MKSLQSRPPHRVVIIGGGFAGLYAAKELANQSVEVTLIDQRNFHLFQPLLYQVATGWLSAADIGSPLRAVFKDCRNLSVMKATVAGIDANRRVVITGAGETPYDSLIVAPGASHSYFGHDEWEALAPGLKTIEDALEIRRRIYSAFEAAEWEEDTAARQCFMTFVIIGAGPTGVELAGALGELTHHIINRDFRKINPKNTEIILIEALDRVLTMYPPQLSLKAAQSLRRLGVAVRTNCLVREIGDQHVMIRNEAGTEERIEAATVLWTAGVRASPLGGRLALDGQEHLDKMGRILVTNELSLPDHPEVFIVGDLAHVEQNGYPLPGIAPVAMAEGKHAAQTILRRLRGQATPPFHYHDKGQMAVIGRNSAVVQLPHLRFSGPLAWVTWLLVHITYLIGYDSKTRVLLQWAWHYFVHKTGARLILNDRCQLP